MWICRRRPPIFKCSAAEICTQAANHCWKIINQVFISRNIITIISLCIQHCKRFIRNIRIKRHECERVSVSIFVCMEYLLQIEKWLTFEQCSFTAKSDRNPKSEFSTRFFFRFFLNINFKIPKWNCPNYNDGSRRIRIHRDNKFNRMCCSWIHWIQDVAESRWTSTMWCIGLKMHALHKNGPNSVDKVLAMAFPVPIKLVSFQFVCFSFTFLKIEKNHNFWKCLLIPCADHLSKITTEI